MAWALSLSLAGAAVAMLAPPAMAQSASVAQQALSIPAGNLREALDALASQSGITVLYSPELVTGKVSPGVSGRHTATEALRRLLEGSGLEAQDAGDSTFTLRARQDAPRQSRVRRSGREASQDAAVTSLPELLVRGSRSLNADIQRTVNDAQPYVVFDREAIERSGAMNINDFLLRRVSASTTSAPASQTGEILGDRSGINLRGLGEGQTLILVDGRRLSSTSNGFSSGQPNLNGIPLAAVERIELLPTTASAIYGGSATGGVINVILRRDFQGGEVAISHDNSFDTDSAVDRIDLTYGFALNEGRTHVMLSGSYSESNALLARDRDFFQRGIEHISHTSPGYLRNVMRPGTLPNLRSANGQNLVLDNGTPLNASFTHVPAGYGGAATDGGAALVGNAGTWNTDPSPDANWFGGAGAFIGAIPRVVSFAASARHQFSERFDGFLDVSRNRTDSWGSAGAYFYSTLPAADPRNPFQQDITVVRSTSQLNTRHTMFNETDRVSTGVIAQLGGDWAGSFDFTWSRAATGYTRRPGIINYARLLGDGFDPLNVNMPMDLASYQYSEISTYGLPVTSYTHNPTLRFSGPLWSLPAGQVSASFLLEQQNSRYTEGTQWNSPNSGIATEIKAIFPPRSQEVRSAYAEITLPLIGGSFTYPGLRALDLQLAGRRDDYESVSGNYIVWYPNSGAPRPDFDMVNNSAAKTTYLIGLKYEPFTGLMVRASRGTGFVPPDVTQLGAPNIDAQQIPWFPDPRRGNTIQMLPIEYVSGSNPNLTPERSTTTAFGVVIQPEALPGFRLSLDYTRLEKIDNISSVSNALLLEYEELFPSRVRRGERLPTDPADWSGPLVYLDSSLANTASATYENLDLQFKYGLELHSGAYLEFWANSTWFLKAETQALPVLEPLDIKGVSARYGASIPLNFRGFYGVNFEKGSWGLGWSVRHYSSYVVANPMLTSSAVLINAQGNGGKVARQLYHDISARWRPSGAAGEQATVLQSMLANLEVSGGIRNLFNKLPPIDVSSDYFFYSYMGDVRMRTYYVQLKYAF